ncbi:MAG TPA: thymidylate synthase, partial [Thermodesulfobacteriota bacterium]|nr:thymidylate synthase [Thermodesulfobacteriota bacterium]
IEATTLDDAWHQAVYNLFDHGYKYTIDSGSYAGSQRIEFDFVVIRIKNPADEPRLPRIPEQLRIPPPVSDDYVVNYFNDYIMGGNKAKGEDYTYGERLTKAPRSDGTFFSQIEEAIRRFRTEGFGTNQIILQVGQPSDLLLNDPPCLRHIDLRIRDSMLHFFPYFRSWDLWGGFPANLAALQLLKEYMAMEIGVADGEIVAASKGLHIYKHVEELAKLRFGKP